MVVSTWLQEEGCGTLFVWGRGNVERYVLEPSRVVSLLRGVREQNDADLEIGYVQLLPVLL